MKVRYKRMLDFKGLSHDKIYTVLGVEKGWYRLIDESGEDYLYPPEMFDVVETAELSQALEGKRVKITCTDGKVFEGTVTDYTSPEDNDPEGLAAIDIEDCPQIPGREVGFNENEISSVEILNSADCDAEQIKPDYPILFNIDISGPDWEARDMQLDEILKKIGIEDKNNT